MAALDLSFDPNPRFRYLSRVHFDELDPLQMLHNSRFAAHVERAVIAYYESLGRTWQREAHRNPDQFHVVRDFRIEFLSPVAAPGEIRIDVWVEHLGSTSCIYGFECTSLDAQTVHARGERAIVKVDPRTGRPKPWSEEFREAHLELRKQLPAAP
jgi:acyl-CoA thioester hydrolase